MKTMFNKIGSAVSGAALFTIGCVMAGIGFAAIGVLAVFALATMGIALLAAPFVRMAHAPEPQFDAPEATDPAHPVEA